MDNSIIIRQLNIQAYELVAMAMHWFTDRRDYNSTDEIWLVQHPQVFTQGHNGKVEHILMPGNIPIIQSNRGGQVTFHGPGQQVMYVMLNLRRRKISARDLIKLLEQTVVATLDQFAITAKVKPGAPGVYVGDDKICSLGLRIRNGCSFHGLALNIKMDLLPFLRINPCGYAGMKMTQVYDLVPNIRVDEVAQVLIQECLARLGDRCITYQSWDLSDY